MKILVCGSRSITNQAWVFEKIENFVTTFGFSKENLTVIHGGAKGIDSLAGQWAAANNVKVEVHAADWARYGRGAGIRRNKDMVLAADYVLILWDGVSKGTKNDIDLCIKNGKQYKIIYK